MRDLDTGGRGRIGRERGGEEGKGSLGEWGGVSGCGSCLRCGW